MAWEDWRACARLANGRDALDHLQKELEWKEKEPPQKECGFESDAHEGFEELERACHF